MSCEASKYKPGTFDYKSPSIVYVFPLPVWPYAKQVTLALLKAASTRGRTHA